MKRIFSLLVLAFAVLFASTSLLAQVQPRDFGGHRLWLDNNSNINAAGYFTYMLQAPGGLTGNATYTFPLIPPGGTAGFVQAGASSAQTLYWNNTSNSWQPSSMLINDNTNGIIVNGGSVLFSGTTGGTPASGVGTRMEWIPSLGALRAGVLDNFSLTTPTNWDNANIGQYSVALGYDTKASGLGSLALGQVTTASGIGTTAMGSRATANSNGSFVYGDGTAAITDGGLSSFTVLASGGTTFYQNTGLLASVAFPAAGGLTVTGNTGLATETNILAQDAHLRSQITTAPTVTNQTNCTASISHATDVAGKVSMTSTNVGNSFSTTITFNKPYTVDPIVIITPTNQNAGDIQTQGGPTGVWVTTPGTGASFTINGFQSAGSSNTYTFNYFVIETQ